jgi:hypothetical protein
VSAVRCRPGDRVRLISTPDPWGRVRPGDEGTVVAVKGNATKVAWDSGWSMPVYATPGGDEIEVVPKCSPAT